MTALKAVRRNGALDLLKFLTAVIIIVIHINNFEFGNSGNASYTLVLFVEMFFIISGFFMMKHIDGLNKGSTETTASFVINKIKRFFAPLCVVNFVHFFLYCIVNHTDSVGSVALKLWHFKWQFLLLDCAGMIQNPQYGSDFLLGQTWFLSAMMLTLVILYPLARYYRRCLTHIICPVSILFIYTAFMQNYGHMDIGVGKLFVVMDALPRAFAGQCCGILCYCAYKSISEKGIDNIPVMRTLLTVSWITIPMMLILAFNNVHDSSVFFIIPMCMMVIDAMTETSVIARTLNALPEKLTGCAGKLSMYIYLTHWTMLILACSRFHALGAWEQSCVCALGTVIYSVLLYVLDKNRKSIKPVCVICVLAVACSFLQTFF